MSRSVPVNADTLGPARAQARDVIAGALDRYALVAPRPRARGRTGAGSWQAECATSALGALTSAGFLVVHQDAMPPDLRAAVAGYQDSP